MSADPAIRFSLVVPVAGADPADVELTAASIEAQTFGRWEILRQDPAPGLARARGEFVAILDPGDRLTPDALLALDTALIAHPDADLAYADESSERGVFGKPDWSPERLRHQDYLAGLTVVRTELARRLGGPRIEFGAAQRYDLNLRASEAARRVVHVGQVLIHRVSPVENSADALLAVQDHLRRIGSDARAEVGAPAGTFRIHRPLPADRRISIVIPTRGQTGLSWGRSNPLVVEAVRSALARTEHGAVEIVVVYDPPTPPAVIEELTEIAGEKLVLVPFSERFNFSRKCNLGVGASSGDVVVLLNDDVQVTSPQWLETLTAPLEDPAVGMTGAKLLYEDGTIQHAGHVYDRDGYFHGYAQVPAESTLDGSILHVSREVAGVTGACAALRRSTYDQVGGLDESLPGNYNDVDLSLKIRQAGYRILWLSDVVLFHFESQSRRAAVDLWEMDVMRERWGAPPVVDPFMPLEHPRRSAYRWLRRRVRLLLWAIQRRTGTGTSKRPSP